MMYKILVVDDEEIVREGIEHTIEWVRLGFHFCGSYGNGSDAAAAVEKWRPDVVITDICMPFGDGLDLTELVMTRYPRTKVVLLSGFDEFQYAQRAVKLGAYDYVLKPITAEELRALLTRVRGDLDREAKSAERIEELSRKLEETRRSRIQLLTARLEDDGDDFRHVAGGDIRQAFGDAGLLIPNGSGALIVVAIDSEPESDALPSDGAAVVRAELVTATGEIDNLAGRFEDHEGRMVVVLSGRSPQAAAARAISAAHSILENLAATDGVRVTAGVGGSFSGAQGFAGAYLKGVRAVEYRFVAGGNQVVEELALPRGELAGEGEWSPSFRSAVDALVRALRGCDIGEAERSILLIAQGIRTAFVSRSRALLQFHAILVHINELREEAGLQPARMEELSRLPTLDRIVGRLRELCRELVAHQLRGAESYANRKAREAARFIEQHFADSSLSFKRLCSHLGVSPSHLSALFKSHTGKTFVEYLTQTRIDRAKHLLMTTDLMSYQVAARIGYDDQRYFCTIFKKSTGRSPMEFRRESSEVRVFEQ